MTNKKSSSLSVFSMEDSWFNDDSLGLFLDAIAQYGTTKLFTEISFAIAKAKKLFGESVHFDTTSLQLKGEYATNEKST